MKVVIATTTLYSTLAEVRAKLALETIRQANEAGYKIVIVDSSSRTIRECFRNQGAIVFQAESPKMGENIRQAIQEATRLAGTNGIVIRMEPEKAPLVPLLEQVTSHFSAADMVIPARTKKSFDSYPLIQQHTEWIGNRAFQILTGRALDVWFGVRIFRSSVSHFFLNYQGEYGDKWDAIFIPVLRAIKAGKRVLGVEVDYIHPQEQKKEEEKLEREFLAKRIEQLDSLIDAIRKEATNLGLRSI